MNKSTYMRFIYYISTTVSLNGSLMRTCAQQVLVRKSINVECGYGSWENFTCTAHNSPFAFNLYEKTITLHHASAALMLSIPQHLRLRFFPPNFSQYTTYVWLYFKIFIQSLSIDFSSCLKLRVYFKLFKTFSKTPYNRVLNCIVFF